MVFKVQPKALNVWMFKQQLWNRVRDLTHMPQCTTLRSSLSLLPLQHNKHKAFMLWRNKLENSKS